MRSPLLAALVTVGTLAGAVVAAPAAVHAAGPVRIVAAENVYGDLARQIGGDHVGVTSILSNPDQDPHLFETSPSTARAVADAAILIANGADYDPWMDKLLAASSTPDRTVIVAAALVGARPGGNPHVWYDPRTLPAVAKVLADALMVRDPADAATYKANLARFEASFQPILARVEAIKTKHAGLAVTATEPVFGLMAEALGFKVLNDAFQLAVMNDAEPSPSQVAAFEDSLRSGAVKMLFYNKQVTDKTTGRMLAIAEAAHIPVVGVTETEPKDTDVQAWFAGQLKAIADALNAKAT